MTPQNHKSALVGISEIVECYLPVSKRKARQFVTTYMDVKRIGNRIYVDREKLERLLADPDREHFPLEL